MWMMPLMSVFWSPAEYVSQRSVLELAGLKRSTYP